ncbi:MAG: flagellar filament capping protein FliD [Caldimonas sp.]
MATISSAGIGSGLDVNSIITQLMAIERQPLTKMQAQEKTLQSTVSEYGKIKSAVSTLRDLSSKLASNLTWSQTVSTSSNAAAVSASTNGSVAGHYDVAVTKLASAQTLATGVFASPLDKPGAGPLHIEVGTWGAGQTSFTQKSGSTAIDLTIDANDTLSDVRDKINSAGSDITAMLMTDGSGTRLLLRSNTTGADSGFQTTGLSALTYDTGSKVMTQSQTAQDSAATLNGIAISSSTNTYANVVDGLTLNLSAVTTDPVSVDVVSDKDSIKKTMTDFAAAYSDLVKMIAADTKYDAAAKKAGLLQGDSAAVGIQRQIRNLAGAMSGASTTFGRLSDAGFQLQADGSMTVDDTKIGNALANLPELKKMFSSSSITDPTLDGFGKRFRVLTAAMLASDGTLASRADGLNSNLDRNHHNQDSFNDRLAATEKRLRAQYTALDATMAKLNGVSGYVTQQIAQYNKNTG